jgi:hypothetical protein
MKIAIDESGDSGRKFWKGSSRWFILTAIIVPDNDFCGTTCQAVERYRKDYNGGRELHFAHNSHENHIGFLGSVHNMDYVYLSVVIDKQKLLRRQPQVFRTKMALVQFSFDALFEQLHPWLDDPLVLLDTNGPKHFNKALSRHLMRLFGSQHKGDVHGLKQVRAVDSDKEPLVQLADYVSGAVHHHVDGKHHSTTFEDYVQDKGKLVYI